MSNQARPLVGPLLSYRGIRTNPRQGGNLENERHLIERRWNSPPFVRLRNLLDSIEAPTKPYKYPPSVMLGFCLVTTLLKSSVRDGRRRVQSDPELRALLGLPSLAEASRARLRERQAPKDVPEEDFPSRTLIERFIHEWLPAHPEVMELLVDLAYNEVPGDGVLRHDVNTARLGVDGTRLPSAHKGRRGEQTDPGALLRGRDGEAAELQRWKMTTINLAAPFVHHGGVFTPESESVLLREEVIPALAMGSRDLIARAYRRTGQKIRGFERALIGGDNIFANTPVYEALYDHDFYGAFEPPDFPARNVEGRRLVTYKATSGGRAIRRQADLLACNDGVHFCECEAETPAGERTPMRQEAGRFGKSGHVIVICDRVGCVHRGRRLYVPFRKPDRVLARGRREAGAVDLTRVTPLWRGNNKVTATNFLARQVVEHYHQQRFEMFGLGSKDRRSGRRFLGDNAHKLWHVLGDLLWNQHVLERLDDGFKPEPFEVDGLYDGLLRNGRNVARLRDVGREARANRAEKERRTRGRRGRFKRVLRAEDTAEAA